MQLPSVVTHSAVCMTQFPVAVTHSPSCVTQTSGFVTQLAGAVMQTPVVVSQTGSAMAARPAGKARQAPPGSSNQKVLPTPGSLSTPMRPAVVLHDGLADGEAEPGSPLVAVVRGLDLGEPLEDSPLVAFGDALSVILHEDPYPAVGVSPRPGRGSRGPEART